MKPSYGVVDSDGHINEPEERLREYIEGPYSQWNKPFHLHSFFDNTIGDKLGTNGPPGFPTPDEWLRVADKGGMETVYIYPTTLLQYASITDPDYLVALTKAYNNYLSEEWLKHSPRFKSVALMPMLEV